MITKLKSRRRNGKCFFRHDVYWWHGYTTDRPSDFIGAADYLPEYAKKELEALSKKEKKKVCEIKKELKIYLISQSQNRGFDTYDSAVVCAESEDQARNMNPMDGSVMLEDQWKHAFSSWCNSPKLVSVECIGVANDNQSVGVICASFNAG